MNGEGIEMNIIRDKNVKIFDFGHKKAQKEFYRELKQYGAKDIENSYWFDKFTGGYYIMRPHHEYEAGNNKELEAAKILAAHGHKLILQNEGDSFGGVSLRINPKTNANTYPDGSIDKIWFEQYTSKNGSKSSLRDAFDHFHEKGVSIGVIYDNSGTISDDMVNKWINHYNTQGMNQEKVLTKVMLVKKKGSRGVVKEYKIRNAG